MDETPVLLGHGTPAHDAACFRSDELLGAGLLSREGANA
jgi:hypothetical protein